jgi:aminoglycoside phosphotransferase (APT) family kinase protein
MTATASPRSSTLASTPSSDAALVAAGSALGLPAAALSRRPLARGVTHVTELVEHEGRPVAVLRLAPPRPDLLPGLDLPGEADVLARLAGRAAVPEMLLSDLTGERLGRPGLLLRYLPGTCVRTWEELDPPAREDAVAALAALHAAPAADGAGLDGSARARLERVRRLAADSGAPPELEATLAALASGVPAAAGAGWAHGDYRPANLVAGGGRVLGVLDWEMAGPGDPARDLGIATMPAWGRWFPDAELLARYRDAGGAPVTLEALRWWRCLGHAMVVAVLAARRAGGWERTPASGPFLDGMAASLVEWRG